MSSFTIDHDEIFLNANFHHFFVISLLFLPLTFSASAAIQFYISSSSFYTIIASFQSPKTLIFVIAFTFFVVLLPTVAGVALIIHTTNQAIHRKRLTFSSTVKSLSYSYIPLLSTFIAGFINSTPIFLLFILSKFAITKANKALGFPSDLSTFSIILMGINAFVFLLVFVFFVAIWGSAPAIAVLQLKSGFEPLRLSGNQSNKFRFDSFFIVLTSGYNIRIMMHFCPDFVPIFGRTTTTNYWISILNVCFGCLYASQMILQYVITNTVLYKQYKVACGGEFVKTAAEEEVSGEYVSGDVNNGGGGGPICSYIFSLSCRLWMLSYILGMIIITSFSLDLALVLLIKTFPYLFAPVRASPKASPNEEKNGEYKNFGQIFCFENFRKISSKWRRHKRD